MYVTLYHPALFLAVGLPLDRGISVLVQGGSNGVAKRLLSPAWAGYLCMYGRAVILPFSEM